MKRNHAITIGSREINKFLIVKIGIVILHVVGIIGLSTEATRPIFQWLTPFHLIGSTILLLLYHNDWDAPFLYFCGCAFTIGMLSEIIGVKTGIIFGQYSYGKVLGPKLMEVPLIIGLNWFLLAYITGELFVRKISNNWLAAFLSAFVMVLLDFLIEPVAIALDFWTWGTADIPLSNYIGWFFVAFLIQIIYRKLDFQKDNPMAAFLMLNLLLFFTVLSFIL